MKKGTKESCQCKECQSACKHKPGWFKFGEAEKVAEYLKIYFKELFEKYLVIDWWQSYPNDIFVLSPGVVTSDTGTEMPYNPLGTCVFFKDGKCSIHAVKPFECSQALHDSEEGGVHKEAAMSWVGHEDQIKNLLGRHPVAAEQDNSWSWWRDSE